MSNIVCKPAEIQVSNLPQPISSNGVSILASFGAVKHLLSDRPLRRPARTSPMSDNQPSDDEVSHQIRAELDKLSDSRCDELAKKYPPPQSWYDEDFDADRQ